MTDFAATFRYSAIGHYALTRETWKTWANLVTTVRLVVGVVVFSFAAVERNEALNFFGLVVYWALDMLDGYLARRLDQETRIGAQLDILADRILVAFFYLNYAMLHPQLILPIAMFLLQFMVIDHFLSNQFLRWPIKSPNYFYKVDRLLWKWNWSPAGKVLNSALVTGVLVATHSATISSLVCAATLALKCWSTYRLYHLSNPEAGWS
jgi:CDP-diacylglycerol--glycerol-3-phosphate 3-phosphatidyltransferase